VVKQKQNILYIEQKYGGHLGFYEGGFICPNPVSWLDRNVVNLADALCQYVVNDKKGAEEGNFIHNFTNNSFKGSFYL